MQIHCPNCGNLLRAENINIQDKLGVCPNCASVFKFEAPKEKIARRKIKQPKALVLREDESSLEMNFRTNFRLDRDEAVVTSLILFTMLMPLTVLLGAGVAAGEVPFMLPILTGFFSAFFLYRLGLTVYNATELVMDENSIHVSRTPLPSLMNRQEEINLSGVTEIRCEETPASIKEGYDTQRYNVWAILADGNRKLIVADLIYDYGFFIAQVLQERLDAGSLPDASRLEDVEGDEILQEEAEYQTRKIRQSQS